MYRRRGWMSGRTRKLIIAASAVALAGGAWAVSAGLSNAGESCAGLDQVLQNNLDFIAGQRAAPDSQSTARIANRQAVVDLINQRRVVAGCKARLVGRAPAGAAQPPAAAPPAAQPAKPPATKPPVARPPAARPPAARPPAAAPAKGVVCAGSTVTLSGEGGAPGASSSQFPIGTTLKVTNLDNNKSTTVRVTGPSGSCILLNNAAFEQVREPGKFLIRRAVIQRVG